MIPLLIRELATVVEPMKNASNRELTEDGKSVTEGDTSCPAAPKDLLRLFGGQTEGDRARKDGCAWRKSTACGQGVAPLKDVQLGSSVLKHAKTHAELCLA